MCSGNMAKRGDQNGDGEPGSQGHSQQADAAGAVAAELEVYAHGAGTEKDERKGAEKLGRELLRQVVHRVASGRIDAFDGTGRILTGMRVSCHIAGERMCLGAGKVRWP